MKKKIGCGFRLCQPINKLSKRLFGKFKDTEKYTIILSIHSINIQFDNSEKINFSVRLKLASDEHSIYTQKTDLIKNFNCWNKFCGFYADPENIHLDEIFARDENKRYEPKRWLLYVLKQHGNQNSKDGSLAKCQLNLVDFLGDNPCITQFMATLEPTYSSVLSADIRMSVFAVKIWSKSEGKIVYSTPQNIFHKPDNRPLPTFSKESLNIARKNRHSFEGSNTDAAPSTNLSVISNNVLRDEDEENEQREILSEWLRTTLEPYEGINFENFSSSFANGRIFLALLNIIAPNLCDYSSRILTDAYGNNLYTPKENLDYALELFSKFKINPIFVESDFVAQNIFIKPNDRYMLQFLAGLKSFMDDLKKITYNITTDTQNIPIDNTNDRSLKNLSFQFNPSTNITLFCSKADAAIDYLSKQSHSKNTFQDAINPNLPSLLVNHSSSNNYHSIHATQDSINNSINLDFYLNSAILNYDTGDKDNILDTLSLDSIKINDYKNKIKHDPLYYLDHDDDNDDDGKHNRTHITNDQRLVNSLKKNAILNESPHKILFNHSTLNDVDFDVEPPSFPKQLFEFHHSISHRQDHHAEDESFLTNNFCDNSNENSSYHGESLDLKKSNSCHQLSSIMTNSSNIKNGNLKCKDSSSSNSRNEWFKDDVFDKVGSIKVEKICTLPTKLHSSPINRNNIHPPFMNNFDMRAVSKDYDRINRLIKEYSGRRLLAYDRFMNMRRFFTFLPENQRISVGQEKHDSFVHHFYDERQQKIANEYLSRASIQRLYRNLFDKIQILNDLGKKLEIESLENIMAKESYTLTECNLDEIDTCVVTMEDILKQMEHLCYNIPGLKVDYDPNIAIQQIDSELHILLTKEEKSQKDEEREKFLINERQRFVDLKNQQLEKSIAVNHDSKNNDEDIHKIRDSFSSFFNHAYGEVKKNVSKFI